MHWLQHHWYRITPLHLILIPISLLFRLLVGLRRALYRGRILPSHKLAVPVIVVGNISVGGTGKTPLTLALAQQFVERGWHPLIISRGYKSVAQQSQPVDSSTTAQQAGDEPLLMAQRNICPVWVGADRVATAQTALQNYPQCNVVLCDDGLQHYRLQRDVEIAVVDGARGFGNGWLLPAGPLREPVSRLQKVDAVVVNRQARSPLPTPSPQSSDETTSHSASPSKNDAQAAGYPASGRGGDREKQFSSPAGEGANESLREFIPDCSLGQIQRDLPVSARPELVEGSVSTVHVVRQAHHERPNRLFGFIFDGGETSTGQYAMRLSGEVFHNLLDPGKTVAADYFQTLNNHAVAGIGHPQRYFQHLHTLGIPFTPHAFPDHHPYRATDLAFAGCDAILMTEKDAVKCTAFADERYWVLRVDAQIDSTLLDHILRKIESHGRKTA